MILSKVIQSVKPSPTIAVSSKAREYKAQGLDIVSLGAGEPDFDTHEDVKKSAIDAINKGYTKYTAVDGTVSLKSAINQFFNQKHNIDYSNNEISVGGGAKQVIFNALIATINPNDEVIIPTPYWVSYPDMVTIAGGVNKIVNCTAENNFKMTAKQLEQEINGKSKWLILNSPSNPTGMIYTEQELNDIAEILRKNKHLYVISDDIYDCITYNDKPTESLLKLNPDLADQVLIINGVSKSYSMTGWRIGYGAIKNKELIKAMSVLQSQSTSNPCSISQYAAEAALTGDQSYVTTRNNEFKKRRDFIVDSLNNIDGISCIKPEGAFYVFPNISECFGKKTKNGKDITNSLQFCEYLLEDELVAVIPGIAFGLEGHMRISYATSMDNLIKAIDRIQNFVKSLS